MKKSVRNVGKIGKVGKSGRKTVRKPNKVVLHFYVEALPDVPYDINYMDNVMSVDMVSKLPPIVKTQFTYFLQNKLAKDLVMTQSFNPLRVEKITYGRKPYITVQGVSAHPLDTPNPNRNQPTLREAIEVYDEKSLYQKFPTWLIGGDGKTYNLVHVRVK